MIPIKDNFTYFTHLWLWGICKLGYSGSDFYGPSVWWNRNSAMKRKKQRKEKREKEREEKSEEKEGKLFFCRFLE